MGSKEIRQDDHYQKIGVELGLPVFNFDLMSDMEKFAPDLATLKKVASVSVV